MNISRLVGLGVLLCLCDAAAAEGKAPAPRKPVALVYALEGRASLALAAKEPRPLCLFDRLAAGAAVEVGPGSRLALAFVNGHRYELGPQSRAVLGPANLTARSGPVRALLAVPPLPGLVPIAENENPGLRAGAVRVRAERIAGLYPRHGTTALAGSTVLRFAPIEGAGRYRIEVQDREGNVVFTTETQVFAVPIPAGTLKPGLRYDWTVRTVDRVGPVAQGAEDFVTLSANLAGAREKLRKAVEKEKDGGALALLAEVDRGLGLLAEAREELQAAVRSAPGDAALAEALAGLEQRLDETGPEKGGVVVEDVTPESLGARAGLQVGDVLLSWCRKGAAPAGPCVAAGRFESPFDFDEMDLEQAPRGGVEILGERAGECMTWSLLPGSPSVEVRAMLLEPLAHLDQEGQSLATSQPADAVERWRSAAAQARQAGKERLGIWLLSHGASILAAARQWPQADAMYQESIERAQSLTEEKIEPLILKVWGKTFQNRGLWNQAEDLYHRSLELDRAAVRPLATAGTLHNLGTMAAQHSNLQEAGRLLRQALAVFEELAPHGSGVAMSLLELGIVVQQQGDLPSAESQIERARSILEALAPGSLDAARALSALGSLERVREKLEEAEDLFRRAKVICERIRPESLEMAQVLYNLGLLAVGREDRESADYFLRRALAIEERLDASGATVASTLESLGLQAFARRDLEKAEEHLRRAVDLNERLDPDGLTVAHNLQNLGVILVRKGDCAAAQQQFQRALAIRQKLNPDGLDVAKSLRSLGFHNSICGDLSKVAEYYVRTAAIYDRLAPGGGAHTMVLHDLGETYRLQGRSQHAVELMCKAADLVKAKLEGSERTEFYDKRYFTDCLSARVEVGQTVEAFRTLEEGRARIFLEQLAERDLLLSTELSSDVVRRRKELAGEIEATQGALARLSSTQDAAETERLLNVLRDLRDQQRELTIQIRKSSPRFASLSYPEPLDLASARRALDPGTVLLAYAVGEERSFLFVVSPPEVQGSGLSVFSLPLGEKALQESIQSFRNLLQKSDSDRSQLLSRARRLYDLLVRPAESRIAPAQRILVSADGPLHTLPFAALVRKGHYLVEWKPVHSVLSATVYAELKRTRRTAGDPAGVELVAFGDLLYPKIPKDRETAPEGLREVLAAVRRGFSLDPLPATRSEVQSIAALYPQARVYLGAEATEERAKALSPRARLLHFACHGLLDERFPLDSALAFTIPEHPKKGQDNGLLQAWEIIESMRLDADLVTLSACDTGLGQEMSGEGLIGLTRAFQYAGARSVLASLWSVSDLSTADLMKRFYGHLRAGKAKDEALQAAQVALIRSPEFSHPYYWAAFQLVGDWK